MLFASGENRRMKALEREVRRLREDLDYLAGAVNRLRGRVTGGVRYDDGGEQEAGDPEGGYV